MAGNDINKIIESYRNKNPLKDIPTVLVPVWQIKIKERFGINVDREIAEYIVLAAHESGTWKKQRAIRKIEQILITRGENRENAKKMARNIVEMAVGNIQE
ncbi:hypothetical protein [Picrophilus oshimae]|uniref:Uncharacterized protein n=1 Tax=Picrophilus torridus (strain ATCC 700027 / DSM 9790 / JCM 10055 / NBRC 100828 / KAW 2/3) TaxID=1122961 RepID=Q6L148_PICTO|nr:hypothetical protein [Picrophilus oshimae]AAT43304.1 hypothetical protein PTO0719 [Picrophilus oshimae DSM 9789]SMD30388.1 hypothetical protein SAMN02745355_0267 [Picrophilus oshimae DSM 9789]